MTAILKSKTAVLDLLILFIFFFKYPWKVFNCEVKIHVLSPKVSQNHLRINTVEHVEGKHIVLSINHISSDLAGHQVQDRDFRFGTIS